MVAPAPRTPVGRYGPEQTAATRRLEGWGLAAAVVVAMLVLGWIGAGVLRDPVQWKTIGFRVDGAASTQVTFDVTTDPGVGASCRVQALSESYAQVGVRDVEVPPADERTRRVTVTVTTLQEAVSAPVDACTPLP